MKDMCRGARKSIYSGITITVVVPKTSDPQYDEPCNPEGFMRDAADRYQRLTAVPFSVVCVAGGIGGWDTAVAATVFCHDKLGDSKVAVFRDKLASYAKASGLLRQKNQIAYGLIKKADHYGIGCQEGNYAVALSAQTNDDCLRVCGDDHFRKVDLATHELAHVFAASHYPSENGLRKRLCFKESIMNYGCMEAHRTAFDSRTKSVVYWNIRDTSPPHE